MKILENVLIYLKYFLICLLCIFGVFMIVPCIIFGITLINSVTYYDEYDAIKKNCQSQKNVKLINIFGNKDLTYENINVILRIRNEGILHLANLSSDVYDYPNRIQVKQIGNFMFYQINEDFRPNGQKVG